MDVTGSSVKLDAFYIVYVSVCEHPDQAFRI